MITTDFVLGFAPSIYNRFTVCYVVCNRFIYHIHLEAYRDHATAQETMGIMLQIVISKYGCPRVMISDRGT